MTQVESKESRLQGAWLEEDVKWVKVPSDISPNNLESAQASLLYFQEGGKFGLIECTVNQEPKKMSISPGDPRGVFKGNWRNRNNSVSVTYKLVEATILPKGTKMPGPMKNGTIHVGSAGTMRFEGKTYRRAKGLDQSAAEALYGIQATRRR